MMGARTRRQYSFRCTFRSGSDVGISRLALETSEGTEKYYFGIRVLGNMRSTEARLNPEGFGCCPQNSACCSLHRNRPRAMSSLRSSAAFELNIIEFSSATTLRAADCVNHFELL
jgi:hypothetical protein